MHEGHQNLKEEIATLPGHITLNFRFYVRVPLRHGCDSHDDLENITTKAVSRPHSGLLSVLKALQLR
jgi:hypothetical protein